MGIQDIKGIGPATIKKLNKAGVKTLADVRAMDVDQVAEKTGLDPSRLKEWKTEARLLKVLEDIKGIGPATKKKLQDAGIHSVDDMARAAVHEVAHATNIAQDRVKAWQQEANRLLKQTEAYVKKEAAVVVEKTKPAREAAVQKGKEVATRGKTVAQAAAKRSGEIAHDVRERVGEMTHKNGSTMPAGGHTAEAEHAAMPTEETVVGANGQVGLLQKIKRIFVKA